ncbi:MAG: hypothetical protein ACFCVF_00540, partial [Kineosporiaceae bacterium]
PPPTPTPPTGPCDGPNGAELCAISFEASASAVASTFLLGGAAGVDQGYESNAAGVWQTLADAAHAEFSARHGQCAAFVPAFLAEAGGRPTYGEAVIEALRAGYAACGIAVADATQLTAYFDSLAPLPSADDPQRGVRAFGTTLGARVTDAQLGCAGQPLWTCMSHEEFSDDALNALGNAVFFRDSTPPADDDAFARTYTAHLTDALNPTANDGFCNEWNPLRGFDDSCYPEPPSYGEAVAQAVYRTARDYGFSEEEAQAMADEVRAQGYDG